MMRHGSGLFVLSFSLPRRALRPALSHFGIVGLGSSFEGPTLRVIALPFCSVVYFIHPPSCIHPVVLLPVHTIIVTFIRPLIYSPPVEIRNRKGVGVYRVEVWDRGL
jgi:hypothetical protein